MSFKPDSFVKIINTCGNYRYGYIQKIKDTGDIFIIDMTEEGLCKIEWDQEYALNMVAVDPNFPVDEIKNFNILLTDTEKRLIPLIAVNMSVKDISYNLNIAPTTVRTHLRDIRLKLGIETKQQLFAYAQGIQQYITVDTVNVDEK